VYKPKEPSTVVKCPSLNLICKFGTIGDEIYIGATIWTQNSPGPACDSVKSGRDVRLKNTRSEIQNKAVKNRHSADIHHVFIHQCQKPYQHGVRAAERHLIT
jgi:hypothetical protein